MDWGIVIVVLIFITWALMLLFIWQINRLEGQVDKLLWKEERMRQNFRDWICLLKAEYQYPYPAHVCRLIRKIEEDIENLGKK